MCREFAGFRVEKQQPRVNQHVEVDAEGRVPPQPVADHRYRHHRDPAAECFVQDPHRVVVGDTARKFVQRVERRWTDDHSVRSIDALSVTRLTVLDDHWLARDLRNGREVDPTSGTGSGHHGDRIPGLD
jgi:hypothetical protein